jgi:hypothetical protein
MDFEGTSSSLTEALLLWKDFRDVMKPSIGRSGVLAERERERTKGNTGKLKQI